LGSFKFPSFSFLFLSKLPQSAQWHSALTHFHIFCDFMADKLILISQNQTWEEALNYCRQKHNDLVSIRNSEEQRWVQERAKNASTPFVWLGLYYGCAARLWLWVTDYVVCYERWASGGRTEDFKSKVNMMHFYSWFQAS
uniref:C-type lectin domain-containing protein n=1 Tax=Pundamilia nyererei TaxID=303518 RepID=A0A3B4ETG9_9CICH